MFRGFGEMGEANPINFLPPGLIPSNPLSKAFYEIITTPQAETPQAGTSETETPNKSRVEMEWRLVWAFPPIQHRPKTIL